jgi:hypothetical protein
MRHDDRETPCHRNGGRSTQRQGHFGLRWLTPAAGLLALLWFLLRVAPKPARASYPCQRVAFPLASGFVAWIVVLAGSVAIVRKAGRLLKDFRFVLAGTFFVTVVIVAAASWGSRPVPLAAIRGPWGLHGPIGAAQGIHPGRVVWVHDPNATSWDGYDSPGHWWQDEHTDLAVVERMMSQAIQGVAGASSDAAAWKAIFRYFNVVRGKPGAGYQPGEKIAIKINLTTCNASSPEAVDPTTYSKNADIANTIDNSPQMILALLRQLVDVVGVDQNDITIGDPTGLVPSYSWNMLHPEFPRVHYLDNYGGSGRTRAEFSHVPFYWSTPAAARKRQDYIPTAFAAARYIINFAILKGHGAGVTLCAKNLYGSLIRLPSGYLRPELPLLPNKGAVDPNYYNMHLSLPAVNLDTPLSPGTGRYRALVDLMGHPELGGKTVLYLIDGLYGGYYWEAHPYKWKMAPFDGDWPSSLLASQDSVAIDSVGYDFVNAEWPDVVKYGEGPNSTYNMQGGAEDYLHEAALANAPYSGTFYDPDHAGVRLGSLGVHEHWNNAIDKQYSRNLGTGNGIELIRLTSRRPPL